jgi:hypothetical protein
MFVFDVVTDDEGWFYQFNQKQLLPQSYSKFRK